MITIYTDGACSGNPGVGGWGVVIIEDNKNGINWFNLFISEKSTF